MVLIDLSCRTIPNNLSSMGLNIVLSSKEHSMGVYGGNFTVEKPTIATMARSSRLQLAVRKHVDSMSFSLDLKKKHFMARH
jgi:hypothetical protein